MKAMPRLKKGDLIIIILLVIVACASPFWKSLKPKGKGEEKLIADVIRDGKLIKELDLNQIQKPQSITLEDGIKLTVLAQHGRIRIANSDCQDKICVDAGWLTKPDDMAVCLPSKTIVRIKAEQK